MPLNRYRVFAKIAETGNMRRAAQEMMYTQQAISRIVKCMEEDYGFPLFIRERDGVRLTPQAEKLLPTIQALMVDEDKLMAEINNIQAEECQFKGVHVGACGSIVMSALNKTLELLNETNPEISVGVLMNANDEETIKGLKAGELDCAVMIEGCHEDMDFEPLYTDEFSAVIPADHPLANKSLVSLEELNKYSNVITPDNPYYDEIMGNHEHNTVVVDEEIMMLPFISNGDTVGIMTGSFDKGLYHNIVIKPLKEHRHRVLGVATKPGVKLTESSQTFIETLKKVVLD